MRIIAEKNVWLFESSDWRPVAAHLSADIVLQKYDTTGQEKCFLNITAHLAFGSWKWSSEMLDRYAQGQLVFRFEPIEADSWDDDMVIRSISPQEITLRVKKIGDEVHQFSWYSDIAGYIGDLFLRENADDFALPEVGVERSVQGIVGSFLGEKSLSGGYDKFQIRAFSRAAGAGRDPNPYGSMQFEGIYKHFGFFQQTDVKVSWAALRPTNYFDYYTNFFVFGIDSDIRFFGQTTSSGLRLGSLKPMFKPVAAKSHQRIFIRE